MTLLWLVPLLPALGALVNGLAGIRLFSRRTSGLVAVVSILGAFGLSAAAFADLLALPPAGRLHEVVLGTWIPPLALEVAGVGIGAFRVDWGLRLDPLAAIMLLVVTGVGSVIHIYAMAYMAGEPRGAVARFFAYLNLFCAFMLLLVLGSNFLVLFVGWEGVGLASYLLIGFFYERPSAADAGKKAFLVNRIGDWGFLLGVLLVFVTFGTVDFREVEGMVVALPPGTGTAAVTAICVCLCIGVAGKSAQLPLFVWLPDAMEGPTPVSALIHAATMVTAGVYVVARNAALFAYVPAVLSGIAVVGAATALMAATVALAQRDIKRVLAYSTVSQLGYMFLALGLGAFGAGIFHLVTHAFFKALLFLAAGAVIHGMAGEQDLHRMGGLRKYLPVTFTTMVAGALAIAGIPPLSGFFSKDVILLEAFAGHRALWAVASVTALLTAFYMHRLVALAFLGEYRGPSWPGMEGHEHAGPMADWHGPHEAPPVMTGTLMMLAVGAITVGFFGVPGVLLGSDALGRFLAPVFAAVPAPAAAGHAVSTGGELGLMLVAVLLAAGGLGFAHRGYVVRPGTAAALAGRWPRVHALLARGYGIDAAYRATVVRGTLLSGRGLWRIDDALVDGLVNGSGKLTLIASWFSGLTDRTIVDAAVNLVARAVGFAGSRVRGLQTGLIQNYALLMLFGVFAFVTLYLFV